MSEDNRPSADDLRECDELFKLAADVYASEEDRASAMRPQIVKLLDQSINRIEHSDRSKGDGSAIASVGGLNIDMEIALLEFKNEIGSGGKDPTVQGAFTMRKAYVQPEV